MTIQKAIEQSREFPNNMPSEGCLVIVELMKLEEMKQQTQILLEIKESAIINSESLRDAIYATI